MYSIFKSVLIYILLLSTYLITLFFKVMYNNIFLKYIYGWIMCNGLSDPKCVGTK